MVLSWENDSFLIREANTFIHISIPFVGTHYSIFMVSASVSAELTHYVY